MAATFKIEAVESIDGVTYVDQEPDLGHGRGAGDHLIDYTPTPGVRYAKLRVTEEGGGGASVSLIVGVK